MNESSAHARATQCAPGGRDQRKWRTRAVVSLLSLLLVGSAVARREHLLAYLARWLDVGDRPRPCDYVLVLPGGEETRPFAAAAMVNRGLAKEVLVPRVATEPDSTNGIRKPSHEVIREVLTRRGVPPGAVRLIGRASTSTYTDALALNEFLQARPGNVIAVVTNDYHTRRARWTFRKVVGNRASDLYVVAVPNDRFDAHMWWRCREGAWAHLSEYAKLAVYFVRYGGWPVWGGGILLAAMIPSACAARRRLLRPSPRPA